MSHEPVDHLLAYVRSALPAPPARVLEIGAGDGTLAQALTGIGYLHRQDLHPALRALEEADIARGALPAVGARFVATRR